MLAGGDGRFVALVFIRLAIDSFETLEGEEEEEEEEEKNILEKLQGGKKRRNEGDNFFYFPPNHPKQTLPQVPQLPINSKKKKKMPEDMKFISLRAKTI